MKILWKLLPLLAVVLLVNADEPATEEEEDTAVVRAVVESCSGWRLNKLPEVKKFIYEDVPLFHNVEYVKKGGAPPVLMLKNAAGITVETIKLDDMSRDQCNELLLKRGFYKKSSKDEEVPEEFQNGPYVAREEL